MTAGSQAPSARVTGVASAVLLVLLLATSGWPAEATAPREEQPVACCVATRHAVDFSIAAPAPRDFGGTVDRDARRPRVAPRPARVDSWGLPPARAPTSARG